MTSGLQHYPTPSLREICSAMTSLTLLMAVQPTLFNKFSETSPRRSNDVGDWRAMTKDLRRLRSRNVVLIDRMLRNHHPHEVLNQVPENTDWRSKTFKLSLKLELLVFKLARSQIEYLDQKTLVRRVKAVSRYLVHIRMRKNIIADTTARAWRRISIS